MGYGDRQVAELEETINASKCDVVVSGTPIDLMRVLGKVNKPMVRVRYDLRLLGDVPMEQLLQRF